MIIKSFTAESAAAALKAVRSEMGGDAVVLKTRHVHTPEGQKRIEVTACLDKASVATASQILKDTGTRLNPKVLSTVSEVSEEEPVTEPAPAAQETVSTEEVSEMVDSKLETLSQRFETRLDTMVQTILERVTVPGAPDARIAELVERFTSLDIPTTFRDRFFADLECGETEVDMHEAARRLLTSELAQRMNPNLSLEHGDAVVFVGAAGSGKTSMLGKLAAHLITREMKKVRLISLDDFKVGAHDEIENYAAILGVEVSEQESDKTELSPVTDAITLIDTPAMPGDAEAMDAYIERIKNLNASHRIAVFSALMRTSDVTTTVGRLAAIEPNHFAFTMLDMTSAYGGLIAAADAGAECNARIIFVSEAAGGVQSISASDPARLALRMIPQEADHE